MINPIGMNNIPNANISSKEKADTEKLGSFEAALEKAVKEKDDKKLREACRNLESVFVNILFKEMRNTIQKSDLIEEDSASETYQDMLFENYAEESTKGRGVGIGDLLYRQLSKNIKVKSEGENAK